MELTADEAITRATEAAERLADHVIKLNKRVEPDPGVNSSESKEQLVERFAPVILLVMMDRYLIVPAVPTT